MAQTWFPRMARFRRICSVICGHRTGAIFTPWWRHEDEVSSYDLTAILKERGFDAHHHGAGR